jgi:hypothetical protein
MKYIQVLFIAVLLIGSYLTRLPVPREPATYYPAASLVQDTSEKRCVIAHIEDAGTLCSQVGPYVVFRPCGRTNFCKEKGKMLPIKTEVCNLEDELRPAIVRPSIDLIPECE